MDKIHLSPDRKEYIFPVKCCYACKGIITKYMNVYYAQDKSFCTMTCRKMLFIK